MQFKRKKMSGEMALQITSMADIFTILLVFLLKSFSTSSVAMSPSQGLELPGGDGSVNIPEVLTVEVSPSGISIDHQPSVTLNQFAFPAGEVGSGGAAIHLSQAFEAYRKKQNKIAEQNADVQKDSKLLLIADKNTPYSTLKTVLASAATHGYSDFKLIVEKRAQ